MADGDTVNVVIDISHHQGNVDLGAARAGGIQGIIHKATQGTSYVDPLYQANRSKASDAGLLWGAYCFGTGADGVEQADFFLTTVKPDAKTLVVLDFEANPQGASMTLEEARAFVTHINAFLGRYPGLYGGFYLKQLLGAGLDPVLANCWLWLSQYGPRPIVPPNWSSWTMWQYTDGGSGPLPHDVPGIGLCDRDIFNGNVDQLQALWNSAAAVFSAAVTYRLMAPYMSGPKVLAIQEALKAAGFDPGPLDGQFGPRTSAAVINFQTAQGLTIDGVVGPQTAAALKIQL